MDVRVGLQRLQTKVRAEELMILNCGVGERLLRVPWTEKRSNQSILKEMGPEYSLEGLMLKLKLQYFGHLMQRADSSEKTLILGKIEGKRRRGQQRMRWLDGTLIQWHEFEQTLGDSEGNLGVLQIMGLQRVGHNLVTEQQQIIFSDLRLYYTKL